MIWQKCERGIWLVNWDKGIIMSPPCGLKSCESCAKRKRKLTALRILKQASILDQTHDAWFYTITPTPHAIYEGYSQKLMADGWSKLRKRLSRRYPKPFHWVCVREMTKGKKEYTDAPPFLHMHIMVWVRYDYEPLLTAKLSDISTELGIGWRCLVGTKERPDLPLIGAREAYYMAKYAGKPTEMDENGDLVSEAIPRAISFSQTFVDSLEEKAVSEGWMILHADDSSVERVAEWHDCEVKNLHMIKGKIDHKSGL